MTHDIAMVRVTVSTPPRKRARLWMGLIGLGLVLAGCSTPSAAPANPPAAPPEGGGAPVALAAGGAEPTPLPTRPAYAPGELVDYLAQTGDTLPALAAHFNTTVAEILEANPIIPAGATTLPPGLPMRIPIYFQPLWGSPYQILPDSLFVNGPAQVGFDTQTFVSEHPGWLANYSEYAAGANRDGAGVVNDVAQNFSVSPRLLLALLEYQAGALSQPAVDETLRAYPLGNGDRQHRGLYLQLVWAANLLNDAYYRWRQGTLNTFELQDGTLERPDPWQNAATVALQQYFSLLLPPEAYHQAISPTGFAATYAQLFGDPWQQDQPHIPGSLAQPPLALPFEPDRLWAYTGGPHTAWGDGEPLAALDFAPPAVIGGCEPSDEWATAVAPGVVARSETGTVVLDLDGDGDERTGWVLFYFHVGTEGRVPAGAALQTGDRVGHPSCEGGRTTGTHVHIARKFNGEWIPADGPLAFDLDGWVAGRGERAYLGTLRRFGQTVVACECSNRSSQIQAGQP